jgi:cytosine/adenosine deaminase-related metal-dependent hydrolase
MIDMIITGATVITMDKARTILHDAGLAIHEGRILEVAKTDQLKSKYQAKTVLERKNHVLLPGLIDAHGHGGHSLLKGVACGNDSMWMTILTDVYKHAVTDDFWYYDGKLAALERLKSGITTGVSVLGSMPRADDPIFAMNHSRGYFEVGIRDIVCTGPCNPPWPHSFSRWIEGKRVDKMVEYNDVLQSTESVIEALHHANDDMTRAFVTPFVIVTSVNPSSATPADMVRPLTEHDKYQAKRIREIAKKYNTRIHSDAFGGMIRMALEDKENALLGPDVHLQHCTGLSFDETKLLAETGTNVSCTPWNEFFHERTPIIELMELGTTVAISSDGTAPNVTYDLFQAMRKTQTLHQTALRDYYYLPPEKLLEMVTIDAAKCIGWNDEIGSLEVGKKADVITINMNQPHLAPVNPNLFIDRIAYSVVANDVMDVVVDGMLRMVGRRTDHVDENQIIEEATMASEETIQRAGIQAFTKPVRLGWGKVKDYIGVEYKGD